MKLSRSFTLEELSRSPRAAREGWDNTPDGAQVERLTWLCVHVLQKIRDSLGKPLHVSSGFRSLQVNTTEGGAKDSAHLYGRAADFEVYGMSNLALAQFIKKLNVRDLDKCILEFPRADDPQAGWVHVQVAKYGAQPRLQYLTARKVPGDVEYLPGLFIPTADPQVSHT